MRRWILGCAILGLCLGCDDGADGPQIIGVGGMGVGGQGGALGGQGGQGGGAGGQGGEAGGQGGEAGGQGGGAGGQGGGAGGQGGGAGGQGGDVIVPDGPGNESTDALCQNGLDDDGDGDIDCDDLHCRSNPAVTVCPGDYENSNAACNDRVDNDGNGFTDCEDFACSRNPWVTVCAGERTPEECTDGIDNDGNGFTDCDDHACSRNPLVGVCNDSEAGFCLDGRDDDGDGAVDCDDSDCDVAAACQGGAGGAGGGGGAGGQGGQGGGCVPDCDGRVCGSDGCDGTCGECDAGALCSDGQCVRDGCPDGTFECGNDCSALVDDTEHCGSCGNACPRRPDTVPLCFEAECYLGCVEGGVFESIDFARDPQNCGRCGNRCPSAIGGAPACAGGVCQSPCGGTSVLCQDRCQSRDVCGNACCPVLAPGERQLPALVRFNNHTWTIENAARRHVTARIRFADGTCPDLDDYAFNVMTIGSNRRIGTLASARPAMGNPGWCAVVDAEVDGHFELQVRPRIDLPAGTVDLAFSAASPARNSNPVSASGIYPAQVNGNAVSLNARFDAITRVLVYAFREVDNVRRCMRSRVQIEQAGTVRGRSDGCPVVEALLRPGDFTFDIRDDGRETPDVSVVVLNAPSPTVRRPLPDGRRFDGADIPNHGIHVYTATLDHPQPVSFTLTGDDCAEGQLRLILPGDTWYRQSRLNDDGCSVVAVDEAGPGDMELWVSGRDMNALADYTVTSPPPIAAGPGRYRQSGIDQGATGRFDWIATENRHYTISIPEGAACTNDDSDAGSPVLRVFRDGREVAAEQQIWRCPEIWQRFDVGRYEITVRGGNGVRVRPFDLLIE